MMGEVGVCLTVGPYDTGSDESVPTTRVGRPYIRYRLSTNTVQGNTLDLGSVETEIPTTPIWRGTMDLDTTDNEYKTNRRSSTTTNPIGYLCPPIGYFPNTTRMEVHTLTAPAYYPVRATPNSAGFDIRAKLTKPGDQCVAGCQCDGTGYYKCDACVTSDRGECLGGATSQSLTGGGPVGDQCVAGCQCDGTGYYECEMCVKNKGQDSGADQCLCDWTGYYECEMCVKNKGQVP